MVTMDFGSHAAKRGQSKRRLFFIVFLFLAASTLLYRYFALTTMTPLVKDTLVIYIFADSNPEYLNNLKHFVSQGVRPHDGADYIFVVQGGTAGIALPTLPPNAKYIEHPNECFDLGTIGWLIKKTTIVDVTQYRYVVWLNSSVRGPYVPAYFNTYVPWHWILTRHITSDLKLFGSTISCSMTDHPKYGKRQHPHVQTYVVASDVPTFHLLLEKKVFNCHTSWQDAIYNGELAASKVVLDAGYNIGCLMLRYQGIDFRHPDNQRCNGGHNPLHVDSYDGVSVNPLEVRATCPTAALLPPALLPYCRLPYCPTAACPTALLPPALLPPALLPPALLPYCRLPYCRPQPGACPSACPSQPAAAAAVPCCAGSALWQQLKAACRALGNCPSSVIADQSLISQLPPPKVLPPRTAGVISCEQWTPLAACPAAAKY